MAISDTQHPSEELLSALLNDEINDRQQRDALEKHINTCSDCDEEMRRLIDDSVDGRIKAAHSLVRHDEHAELTEIPHKMQTEQGEGAESVRRLAPRFLADHPDHTLLEKLGEGGMGAVFKAYQKSLKRTVVIKTLLHVGEEQRARFRTEAEAAARLMHPNIVQIYEVGESEGQPYMVLEYVDGPNLAELVHGTPQEVAQTAELLEILARAIHHAHGHGIVHRDLKPANILLSRGETDAKKGQAAKDAEAESAATSPLLSGFTHKIADFGLAKLIDTDASQTQSGAIMGTPSYMSPEQATGQMHEIGPATDIYALGAILYELLSGRPPFKGPTTFDTLEQVRNREPVSPHQLRPNLPRDLVTICLKCLQKEHQKRYETANDLAEDLRRFRRKEPIVARPVGNVERVVKWAKRQPAIAALIAAVVVLLVSGTGVSTFFAIEAQNQAAEAKQKEKEATQARDVARAQEKSAKLKSAGLAVDRGIALCEMGDVAQGMLWLTHSLTLAEDKDLERVVRFNLDGWKRRLHPLRACLQHKNWVRAVAFSPDGKTAATGSEDNTVRFWDVQTGMEIGAPLQHDGPVRAVAFSPNGKLALTGSEDKTAQLWNVKTRQRVGEPILHRRKVRTVAFSPDGKKILTAGSDNVGFLWDAKTQSELGKTEPAHSDKIHSVAFSPKGDVFVTASNDGTVMLWDAATCKPTGKPLKHGGAVLAVVISPDGKTCLTGSFDRRAQLWDLSTGQPIGKPYVHFAAVRAIDFGSDGKTIMTGSWDTTVRLWDIETGKPVGAPLQHGGQVYAVAFSPDGRKALTGSWDNTARIWEISKEPPSLFSVKHDAIIRSVSFHPDGKVFACGSEDGITQLWNSADGSAAGAAIQREQKSAAYSVAFDPQGRKLVIGYGDNLVCQWDVQSKEKTGAEIKHKGPVYAAVYSPDGDAVLSGCNADLAKLWRAGTGELIGGDLTHAGRVNTVAFAPNGNMLATGGWEGKVKLWDRQSGKPAGEPIQCDGPVTAVTFGPAGRLLLTCIQGETAQLWDVNRREPVGAPFRHPGLIWCADFHHGGRMVLTGSLDGTARTWDVATRKALGPPLTHLDSIYDAEFSPDGRLVLTASADRTAKLWRTPAAMPGDVERLGRWVHVITGMKLGENGVPSLLDARSWQRSLAELKDFDGASN